MNPVPFIPVGNPATVTFPGYILPDKRFYIPLRFKKQRKSHSDKPETEDGAESPASQEGKVLMRKIKRVILADDDQDDCELFEDALREINARLVFHCLRNGDELMQYLKTTRVLPDIIFLDLNMPGKGGKECLEEIRSHKKLKDIPVIIYSTSSFHKDIDETHKKGASLYVRKPHSFQELIRVIADVLILEWPESGRQVNRDRFLFENPGSRK